MPVDLKIPQLGESITEAEILLWRCADGDVVAVDEIIVELETDKTTVELPSPAAGTLRILKQKGALVAIGDVIGQIEEAAAGKATGAKAAKREPAATPAPAAAPAPMSSAAAATSPTQTAPAAARPAAATASPASARLGPAARRAAEEQHVDPSAIQGTGPGGRITKTDVATVAAARQAAPAPAAAAAKVAPAPASDRSADD